MNYKDIVFYITRILSVFCVFFVGLAGIICFSLFVDAAEQGFLYLNSAVLTVIFNSVITVFTVLSIVFLQTRYKLLAKILIISVVSVCLSAVILYILKSSGFFEKITSVESFREYVESFGKFAILQFIFIQFLQVVILPIPSVITMAAGVLMFGAFKGALFSCIGIIAGSIVAFKIGKVFGYKAVKWLVGEKALNKGLKLVKGKDKILFTFMFLFPCFPDDLMCFTAGITKLNTKFFIIMVILTRTVAIFMSAYSINNQLIPYDTWWGILIWILFFVFTLFTAYIVFRKAKVKDKNNKEYNL